MKKFLLSIAFAAAALTSVHAAEMEGVVKSVDAEKMMIMLEDGTEVTVAEDVMIDELAEGVKVMIMTDDAGVATEVTISE